MPIIYGKEYNEILNDSSIRASSIANSCGIAVGHMIKYMIRRNKQSPGWIPGVFRGYEQFSRASETTEKMNFLSDPSNKFSNIVYKSAKDVLKEVDRINYSKYYKNEPKYHYWTNAQLVDPEFIRTFLLDNRASIDKGWLEQEIDKFIKKYK